MRGVVYIVAGLGAVFIVFKIGYSQGLGDCAARADIEAESMAVIDREIAAMMAEPTGRDLVCEKVFDLVEDELHKEVMDEQFYLDSVSVPDR